MAARTMTPSGECYRHVIELSQIVNGEWVQKTFYFGPYAEPRYGKAKGTLWINSRSYSINKGEIIIHHRYDQLSRDWVTV